MEFPGFLKFKESNKRILSIDFGGSFIKVAYLEANGGKYTLLACASKAFNSSQKSSEELTFELKTILKSNLISGQAAYLSIADPEWIFIKKLILPQMPKDELLSAVKWQLKDEFPFSPEESVAELEVVREYSDSEGVKKVELFCVFAKKDVVDKYLRAVNACGIYPQKISISAFNYCNTLASFSAHSKVSAILDIGQTHSQIAIYQDSKLNFLRSLNFSTSEFAQALVGTLVTGQGKVEINLDKAGELMQQQGIPLDDSVKLNDDVRSGQIIPLVRPLLETVVKELERSFDYFKSESSVDGPGILYITGGGANLKNLDDYLAGQLKIEVVKLPLPDSLDIKSVDLEKSSFEANQFSSALGLGVSVSGINLLPREIKSQKIELLQESTLRIAAIVISAVFIFSWLAVNFQIRDYRSRLKIAKLHLQSVEEIKSLKQTVDLRENLVSNIRLGKVPSGGLLKLAGAVIPISIILNEFDFDQASHSMHLYGIVLSSRESVEKVLTDFMNSLEKSKFVQDANLVNSREEQGINNFEIECKLAR